MPKQRNRLSAKRRRVRGTNADLSDIRLLGEEFRANVRYEMLRGVMLSRTIEGASTLTIPLLDPDCRLLGSELLTSKFDVELDDLWFRLAALDRQGDTTTLTFEDREVAYMRRYKDPRKVLRSKMTRAEFILSMVKEVKEERIPTYILELHKEQPIADSATPEDAPEIDVKGNRKGGSLDAKGLTVKGVAPNSEQIRNAEVVLGVGVGLGAPRLALEASIVSGIQENNLTNNDAGPGCRGYFCIIDSTAAGLNFNPLDLEKAAESFFKDGFGGPPGAIEYAKQNPGQSAAEVSSAIEGNAAGASDRYQWEGEAKEWVDAYSGGGISASGGGATTVDKPYAFERKDGEDTWTCAGRLADEVQWRRFMSSGVFYYASEEDLFLGPVLMDIDEPHPKGIDDVSFNWDGNKRNTEVTIEAYMKDWAAPPGSVIRLGSDFGPVQGRYIVSTIDKNLDEPTGTIVCKRPMKELPEPAPETVAKTGGRRSGGSAGASFDDLASWAEAQVGKYTDANEPFSQALGYSRGIPWCSVFVGYGLEQVGVKDLPANPAYSGDWLSWSGGQKVSVGSVARGDIVVFDWGDGGETDHVAIYVGGGQVVGGNQSDAVTKTSFQSGSCVGAVRVK